MPALKVTAVGSAAGVVLPKEALVRLKVKKGDKLFLLEAADGYEIVPCHPEFLKQMEAAEGGMRRYRNALRELAK
jgi:putative addiction module antidote